MDAGIVPFIPTEGAGGTTPAGFVIIYTHRVTRRIDGPESSLSLRC